MGDKEDYLTSYREFFEQFAATVNPEDQLPVSIAGYTITEAELPGEVLYWITQYLAEKQCPLTLMTPLRRIILDEVHTASKKQPNDFGYKADESVYIALRLMQAVTARVNDVCLRYLDNAKLDTLPPPPPPNQRELKTVSIATKNSRRVMEDRHVEIGNLEALFGIETTEPTSFYAVYDGHAGSAAAMYCAAHLHQYLVESPHFTNDLKRALRDAFLKTDHEFVRKSNQERACGGSTAVCVCVRGRRLTAAWAGDSLALLAKRMRLMQLVRAHKPGRQDERERIEQSGGTVMYWGTWRVNGQLAVSRAIGDAQYKPYVTARPETATVDLDGDEDFVVVACDGLWDFVSEDDVALAIYRQLAADPDDLKAVTKRLVLQAKRQGSSDNISIIVVFLKEPRDIAADNSLPMDLGLDNALANAPPFVMETEACKRVEGAPADAEAECDADADNGVDNSDSDSEDLGPETAVDVDLDAEDLEVDTRRHSQPPTPLENPVEENHVDGSLADNVAESGEESEDEWNYFKGEGEPQDEPPRDQTPCQDNSAWETSSVEMNTSPLNPDAPVFVPGGVADEVLAASPRKPLPMDDLDLPDVAQFATEATGRPADLLDLDNCDQLNGHHNVSIEDASKEHLNGNEKCTMDSLGFGFGLDSDKAADTGLIQDFQRIQKDTTDFCNIQVFQTHTETNPFAATEGNEELFERLKNKERDPMSMSFYQEKDDDTCERLMPEKVDLNAVQPLPESDDDEPHNGHPDSEKENISPDTADLLGSMPEPNNDIMRYDNAEVLLDNATDFGRGDNIFQATNDIQPYSNIDFESEQREEVAHTETPESHKLLFEQIPEIPDGKSSELGFNAEDAVDPESDNRVASPQEVSQDGDAESKLDETSQDVDMESKPETPSEELQQAKSPEPQQEILLNHDEIISQDEAEQKIENELVSEMEHKSEESPMTNEINEEGTRDIIADIHAQAQDESPIEPACQLREDIQQPVAEQIQNDFLAELREPTPELKSEGDTAPISKSPVPTQSPFPSESPAPMETHLETAPSPVPIPSPVPTQSPLPVEPEHIPSPIPPVVAESPLPAKSPLPTETEQVALSPSPAPIEEPPISPEPADIPLPRESPASNEPAPDIVPEDKTETSEVPKSDLVTDLDIGIPESRAQEICVPVTQEIKEVTELTEAKPNDIAPVNDTPIAADVSIAVAVAAGAAGAAIGAAVAKTKTPTSATKKSPTTPKPGTKATPKPAAKATPTATSAKKPVTATPPTKTPVAKTTPARTPLSKPATPKAPTPAKPASAKPAATTKAAAPATKPAAPRSAPISRPAPRPAAKDPAKPTTAASKDPATKTTAHGVAKEPTAAKTTTRPATARPTAPRPRPAPARPATATAASKPASAPAPAPAPARVPLSARTKPAPAPAPAADKKPLTNGEKKPLTNGDVKPAARPAPRPTPRAAPAAASAKPAAPKPAPRTSATRPTVKDADKQSKDLANRRLTARAAPPRTQPPKAPVGQTKPPPIKNPARKAAEAAAKKEAEKKEALTNGNDIADITATNGGDSELKAPPSPSPAADGALLPDVIA